MSLPVRKTCLVFSHDLETRRRLRLHMANQYNLYEADEQGTLAKSVQFIRPNMVIVDQSTFIAQAHTDVGRILHDYISASHSSVIIVFSPQPVTHVPLFERLESAAGRIYTMHSLDALLESIQQREIQFPSIQPCEAS